MSSENSESMPFNVVGSSDPADIDRQKMAEKEAISLEEWSKNNLPAAKITFRWRYANRTIQLYERRLHSLANFNVGPAIQAWARSRMEWMRDERLYEKPNGVIVFSVDPDADIDIALDDIGEVPSFSEADLEWGEGDRLQGTSLEGTVWVIKDGTAIPCPSEVRHAADTLVRDLVKTFGFELVERTIAAADLESAEVFFASDEFGAIPCTGHEGEITDKMVKSFDKLWTLAR